MQSQKINNSYNQKIGMKFPLSQTTKNHEESIKGLSYSEITRTPIKDTSERIKQRGTLKKPNPIKEFFLDIYRKIGKKQGY